MHLLVITHYYEPNGGAASIHLTELTRRLHRRGHRITVLTTMPHYPRGKIDPDYRRKFFHHEIRAGIDVYYAWLWATPSPKISRKLISQLSFMFTALLRGVFLPRPDVVYIEAQPIFTGLAGRIISRLKRVPYVLNVSDLWPDHLLTLGKLKETHPIYRAARYMVDSGYRGAERITTMSPMWSRKVAEYIGGDGAKINTILLAVDTGKLRPISDTRAFREKYDLGDKRIIAYMGTFATQYDFETILDTAVKLKERADIQFLLIGTGSRRDYIQQRLSSDANHVRLIDWIEHDEMPLAWNATHIAFWALNDHDLLSGTLPTRIFEAMACGTPIAAAHKGEAASILEKSGAGLSVIPGDSDGLAEIITRLLDSETLYKECCANGRSYAEREFDFEVIMGRYEAVLQDAIEAYG